MTDDKDFRAKKYQEMISNQTIIYKLRLQIYNYLFEDFFLISKGNS